MRRTVPVILATATIAIILVYAFAPVVASYDVRRVERHEKPIFAHYAGGFLDGGTILYEGPGYEIQAKHRPIGADLDRWDTGIALSFSLPFYRRFNYETRVESVQ
jgi:hypothetical protein